MNDKTKIIDSPATIVETIIFDAEEIELIRMVFASDRLAFPPAVHAPLHRIMTKLEKAGN